MIADALLKNWAPVVVIAGQIGVLAWVLWLGMTRKD